MLSRRAFIGTIGKLAAIASLAPAVKAGEAKEVVQPKPYPFDRKDSEWATQYLLEPAPIKRDLINLTDSLHKLPPRCGKTHMMEVMRQRGYRVEPGGVVYPSQRR